MFEEGGRDPFAPTNENPAFTHEKIGLEGIDHLTTLIRYAPMFWIFGGGLKFIHSGVL